MHGGASPRGIEHPRYIHGRYSKDITSKIFADLGKATADPELSSLRHELALLDARADELLGRVGDSAPEWRAITKLLEKLDRAIQAGDGATQLRVTERLLTTLRASAKNFAGWHEAMKCMLTRAKLTEAEIRRTILLDGMITVAEFDEMLHAMGRLILEHVPDEKARVKIAEGLRELMTRARKNEVPKSDRRIRRRSRAG
jgi:hypothetical protein